MKFLCLFGLSHFHDSPQVPKKLPLFVVCLLFVFCGCLLFLACFLLVVLVVACLSLVVVPTIPNFEALRTGGHGFQKSFFEQGTLPLRGQVLFCRCYFVRAKIELAVSFS